MRPSTVDLFGEVPVYTQDVDLWLLAVPRISPGSRRAGWYIQAYDVAGKIRAAKLAGRFDEITARLEPDDWFANRFSWAR